MAAKKADFAMIGKRFGIDPVTARIIRNRDLTDEDAIEAYLSCSVRRLHDPHQLKDADKGAAIVADKIRAGKKIRVIGDYDIDGVNAAYILLKGFEVCGADADHVIPDRIHDGYGMNAEMIQKAFAEGVDTIITCDNGISAIQEIAAAREYGMTVIVTDHHDVPFTVEEDGEKNTLFRQQMR